MTKVTKPGVLIIRGEAEKGVANIMGDIAKETGTVIIITDARATPVDRSEGLPTKINVDPVETSQN